MKRLLTLLVVAALCAATLPAYAALNVFACEPEWAALTQELGGTHVNVFSATTATQDPHRIEARPSLIAKMRQSDMVVCTGADLEIGWLPLLLRQAGNAKVQPGRPGYFEAAVVVERLDVPRTLDRSMGDVHAGGNPHVHTDPRRIATIARHLSERLIELDAANATTYRANHERFAAEWQRAITRWSERAAPLKGTRVLAHHKDWIYLYDWLGLVDVGTLEAKPGVPPSAAHLADLKRQQQSTPARMVLRTPYQDPRPSQWIARETGIKEVVLPYTVGGSNDANNLYALFDVTIRRLLEDAQ